jgi:aryl-phospho-beta-D-glucosidase BglC (GH1 family)
MYIRLQNEQAKYLAAKAMGANVVRLMLWKQDIENNPGTANPGQDQRGLAAIDDAVRWAHDAGLRVILVQQIWSYQVEPAPPEFLSDAALQTSWLSMWRTLIDRYKNDETVIGVDLMNEPWNIQPRPLGAQASWEAIAKNAVTELRPRNPHLLFAVEGWGVETQPMWSDLAFLQQPNIILSDHIYGQRTYQFLSDRYSAYSSQNIPIWLGEIGFLSTDQSFMVSQLNNFDLMGLHYTMYTFGASQWGDPYDLVDASYALTSIGQEYSEHLKSLGVH